MRRAGWSSSFKAISLLQSAHWNLRSIDGSFSLERRRRVVSKWQKWKTLGKHENTRHFARISWLPRTYGISFLSQTNEKLMQEMSLYLSSTSKHLSNNFTNRSTRWCWIFYIKRNFREHKKRIGVAACAVKQDEEAEENKAINRRGGLMDGI